MEFVVRLVCQGINFILGVVEEAVAVVGVGQSQVEGRIEGVSG